MKKNHSTDIHYGEGLSQGSKYPSHRDTNWNGKKAAKGGDAAHKKDHASDIRIGEGLHGVHPAHEAAGVDGIAPEAPGDQGAAYSAYNRTAGGHHDKPGKISKPMMGDQGGRGDAGARGYVAPSSQGVK